MSVSSCLRRRVIKNIESDSATGTVNVGVSSTTVNLGTSQIGTVNVGIAGSTIALKGTTSVTTLDGTSASAQMSIGGNLTDGLVRIAQGAAFTGNIAIGANSTIRTGTINIGTNGAGAITIGNASAPLALNGSTTTLGSPLTLGTNSPGLTTPSGATGTFDSDLLGNTQKINNTSLTITDYNTANVVASYYITKSGLYLATWSIQQQITTPPNGMTVNVGINNTSITATTGSLAFANFGMTKLTNFIFGSNGSVLFQTSALRYCNLVLTIDGGAGFSAPAITFYLTRLG